MQIAAMLEEALAHTNNGAAAKLIWEFRITNPNRRGSQIEIIGKSRIHTGYKIISVPVIAQARINILILEIDAITNALLSD